MITPEAQKIIDELKQKIANLESENTNLKNQLEEVKRVAQETDNEELFDGIFDF